MRDGNKGFTLIELIIVMVIIGILAAVSAPLIQNIKARAICTEAIVGMAAIRMSLLQYRAEKGFYPEPSSFIYADSDTSGKNDNFPGLTLRFWRLFQGRSDLDGTYFNQETYQVLMSKDYPDINSIYCLPCSPDNKAPKHTEASSIVDPYSPQQPPYISMSLSNGRIRQYKISRSGFSQ